MDVFAAAAMLAEGERPMASACDAKPVQLLLPCLPLFGAAHCDVWWCTEEDYVDGTEDTDERVGREEFLLVTQHMLERAQQQKDMLQKAAQRGCV